MRASALIGLKQRQKPTQMNVKYQMPSLSCQTLSSAERQEVDFVHRQDLTILDYCLTILDSPGGAT